MINSINLVYISLGKAQFSQHKWQQAILQQFRFKCTK